MYAHRVGWIEAAPAVRAGPVTEPECTNLCGDFLPSHSRTVQRSNVTDPTPSQEEGGKIAHGGEKLASLGAASRSVSLSGPACARDTSVFVRGWGAPASLPPPTRPATLQQLPIHRLLSCKLPPPSRSCRCFSLIKGLINTCQSNGPGWEGASALITKTVSQEVFSVWEEHFRLGGMKEPSYKMKRQVVFIWAHASEFTCLISASVPTDA